jgi:phage-related protein
LHPNTGHFKLFPPGKALLDLLLRVFCIGTQSWGYANTLIFYLSIDIIFFMKKTLRFIGSSLDDLKNFPAEARREAGFELDAVQRGQMPSDFKPMLTVGAGAYEIRLHVLGEWRVMYVAKKADAVYVLHAFQKKTQKTRREDIDLAARRYQQIGE